MRHFTSIALFALIALTLAGGPALAADDAASRFRASYALEGGGDYPAALAELSQLDAGGPLAYAIHLRRGWLLYLAGRHADAVAAYRAAIDAEPSAVEPVLGVTLPLMALRRWKEAEDAARDALALAPGHYTAASRLAYVLYNSGRHQQAAQVYGTLVELYPADVEMRTGQGWALLKAGDARRGCAAFDQVLAIAPAHTSAAQGAAACK